MVHFLISLSKRINLRASKSFELLLSDRILVMDYAEKVKESLCKIGGYLSLHLTGSRARGESDALSNWDFVIVASELPSQVASKLAIQLSEELPVIFSHIEPRDKESAILNVYLSEDGEWRHLEIRIHSPSALEKEEELRQRRAVGQWRTLLEIIEEEAPKVQLTEDVGSELEPHKEDNTLRLFHELWRNYPRALVEYQRGRALGVLKALERGQRSLQSLLETAGKFDKLSELEGISRRLNSAKNPEEMLQIGKQCIELAKPALIDISEDNPNLPVELLDRFIARIEDVVNE